MTASAPPIAERIGRLGTETAFAVSAEAAVWQGKGHTVCPFYLGNVDLATPQNIVEAAFRALREGKEEGLGRMKAWAEA